METPWNQVENVEDIKDALDERMEPDTCRSLSVLVLEDTGECRAGGSRMGALAWPTRCRTPAGLPPVAVDSGRVSRAVFVSCP